MGPLAKLSTRRAHLDQGNLLRSLTEVINKVEGGINLGQGVCDLDAPLPLRQGAVRSIEGGDRQTYTAYAGLPELRDQIARKLRQWNGLDVAADSVVVTAGSSGAFIASAMALCDPGDEVVLFEPFYSYHRSQLLMLGLVPVFVPLVGEDLVLDVAVLKKALTSRTRAVVVNTPANPSGRIFSKQDLEALAGALAGTDIVVLTDEVYEYMCFDGRKHVSPAAVEGLKDRTLTIGGFSKTFSVTGWRIGYVAGPPQTVDAVGRVFDQINVCAPRPLQRGVEQALRVLPVSFYQELQASYQARRDRFCTALSEGGFRFREPEGAYYVMVDYRPVFGDVDPYQAVLAMIERIGVNGVPGHMFFEKTDGVRSLRFHFAVRDDVLEEVCRRLSSLGSR